MIVIDNTSAIPLYFQIYEQIKEQIISGQLVEGSKLPSTRSLSIDLKVSRNTVESAYQQLCSEGYVESKASSGFVVLKLDSFIISKIKREYVKNVEKHKILLPETEADNDYKYVFQYGSLSAPDFPLRLWKRISNKCLAGINAEDMTTYMNSKGELALRIELMNYLNKSRGVSCNPEQIIVSSGMEYCLSLLCQLFRSDFNEIALEDPGYIGARSIFLNNGYDVVPISLENGSINLDELEKSSPKIVYVTPSHQFPTGSVMPVTKRLQLLDWAIRNNGFIIEDDYDSELRYNSRPIPSIQSIASKEHVVYIGTFSKALSPSLRVNYMVLPQILQEKYNKLFSWYQCPIPIVQQKILQQFMHLGHWETHLRKISLVNKRKHDVLIRTIQDLMGYKITIHAKNAGLHILLEVNNGLNEQELIAKAKSHGVKVFPVSIFWMRQDKYPDNMVLLGFGGMTEGDIIEGVKLLKDAWFNQLDN
jgi:GntR family transcriptional regulator/MocR family aminotransferase